MECKLCGNNKIYNKLVSNKIEFTKRSCSIHKNKYNYSGVIYINALTNVEIICPIHGKFTQTPSAHLNGSGCPKCGVDSQKSIKTYSNEEYICRAKLYHESTYDYSKVNYINSHTKIIIICKKHGEFTQTPNSHLNGNGCPKCIHIISDEEINFLKYLNINNRQIHINPYKVDGYDPTTNTVYEFLGDYWHGNPIKFNSNDIHPRIKKTYGELYNRTFKKFEILKLRGYNIKYIWEFDWKKFKNGIDVIPNIIIY